MYTVLARKYRSRTFDDVVGQDAVATTLKNAIKTKRVAHAYLFNGTRGVGKTTMARILAKALNCLSVDEPTTEPCCECESCIAINTGDDIDVLEIDGASNNGVDQVRELRDNAIYRPARARYKIYIIDEVHMLTVAAFNALLKILEEPPDHVKFIFATTEPNKVLATIQSRCQCYDFRNISAADIAGHLKAVLNQEKIAFEDDLVLSVAKLANGSMRDGLSLLDRLISTGVTPLNIQLIETFLGQANVERIYELINVMGQQDAAQALLNIDALIQSGLSETQIVDALIDALRDLMVIRTAGPQGTGVLERLLVLTKEQQQKAESLAQHFDAAALIYMVTALEKVRWTVKNSDTPRTLLEATILRLTLSDHFINVDTLMSRLNQASTPSPKKKHLTETVNPKTQITATPDPPAVPKTNSVPHAETNLQSIQANWEALVSTLTDRLGAGTGSLLQKARPTQLADHTLTITFAPGAKIQKEMCENNGRSEQITNILKECLNFDLRIAFTLDTPSADEAIPIQEDPAAARKRRNDLLNDPAVKTVLMGLNATVTSIEEYQA